jgi:hypothetical protein
VSRGNTSNLSLPYSKAILCNSIDVEGDLHVAITKVLASESDALTKPNPMPLEQPVIRTVFEQAILKKRGDIRAIK